MKLVPTVKYNTQDIITQTLPIFYGIISFILLFSFVIEKALTKQTQLSGGFYNVTSASIILVFILGLILTRTSFRHLTQTGVSRNTQIAGKAISVIVVAAVVVLADRLFDAFWSFFFGFSNMTYGVSDFPSYYFEKYIDSLGGFAREGIALGMGFAIRIMVFSGALFISMLLYRISTILKILIFVGVPSIFILNDIFVARFSSVYRILNWINKLNGIEDGNPIKMILFLSGLAIFFFLCYFLVARRAPVKD